MTIAAILLAAGASRRMRGLDKLTEYVRGATLLRDRAEMLLESRLAPVIIVLPEDRPMRTDALEGLQCERLTNPDAMAGMASSITTGVSALPSDVQAVLIMPADMPDITTADVDRLHAAAIAAPGDIIRATDGDGTAGSPVIFPKALFFQLLALTGDESGRAVIKANAARVQFVALPGTHATLDLDTPEAWAVWRKAQD